MTPNQILIGDAIDWLETYADIDLYVDEDFDPKPKVTCKNGRPCRVEFTLGIENEAARVDFIKHIARVLKRHGTKCVWVADNCLEIAPNKCVYVSRVHKRYTLALVDFASA